MISRRAFVGWGAFALSSCSRSRKTAFAGYAFVANEGGHALAVVDLSAFAVIRHIPLDAAPTHLATSPAQKAVYALCPGKSCVQEVNTENLKLSRRLNLPGQIVEMRLNPQADTLWLLTKSPHRLIRIPLDSFQVAGEVRLPSEPCNFDLANYFPRAAVGFRDSFVAVDLQTGYAGTPISLGAPVGHVLYRSDGRHLIVSHPADRLLTAVDAASNRTVVKLPLAMTPENFCVTGDGGQLFVTGPGMDAVAIVFPHQTEVAETILAGHAPGPMAASFRSEDTPEYLFVTNPQAGQVTILNIGTRKVMAVAAVGTRPETVVITPDNQFALVLNRQSGDMAVLLIQSAAKRRKVPAALLTMIPVGSNPVSAVVRKA